MKDPQWSVYMVRCGDGSLYTGIATDVARRVAEHASDNGKSAKYLRGRGPLQLVLEQPVGDRGFAQRVENQIKKLPKAQKEDLIANSKALEPLLESAREIAS